MFIAFVLDKNGEVKQLNCDEGKWECPYDLIVLAVYEVTPLGYAEGTVAEPIPSEMFLQGIRYVFIPRFPDEAFRRKGSWFQI